MKGKRKITSEHKRDGTFRPDRNGNRLDAMPMTGKLPLPPEILGEHGKILWFDVCSQLPEDALAKIDAFQLQGMCEWWQQWREIQEAIKACSDVLDPSYYKLNQMSAVVWKHFAAASSRFGMTPYDRSKIKVDKTEQDDGDPLTALKARRA